MLLLYNSSTFGINKRIIKDDKLIPPKLIRQDPVYKKSNTLGKELRYVSLGVKQMIISKDKELNKIVNVIPIDNGTILLNYDLENKCKMICDLGVNINNSFRSFELKFCEEAVIDDWISDYKEAVAGTNELLKKYANDLLSYLIKSGSEELKVKRLKVIESEMDKLSKTLNRLEREK